MKVINKHTVDEWLFDYFEGNLSVAEKETLTGYLNKHPELQADYNAWKLSYVDEPEVVYPNADKLIVGDKPKRGGIIWFFSIGLLLLITGGILIVSNKKSERAQASKHIAVTNDKATDPMHPKKEISYDKNVSDNIDTILQTKAGTEVSSSNMESVKIKEEEALQKKNSLNRSKNPVTNKKASKANAYKKEEALSLYTSPKNQDSRYTLSASQSGNKKGTLPLTLQKNITIQLKWETSPLGISNTAIPVPEIEITTDNSKKQKSHKKKRKFQLRLQSVIPIENAGL